MSTILLVGERPGVPGLAERLGRLGHVVQRGRERIDPAQLVAATVGCDLVILAQAWASFDGTAMACAWALEPWVAGGGRLLALAPVMFTGDAECHPLLPAAPLRRSSSMRSDAGGPMQQVELAASVIPIAVDPRHPVVVGGGTPPCLAESVRPSAYGALFTDCWKPRINTEVIYRTADGEVALAMQRYGQGASALLRHDPGADAASAFDAWSGADAWWSAVIAHLSRGTITSTALPDLWQRQLPAPIRPPWTWQRPTGTVRSAVEWQPHVERHDLALVADNRLAIGVIPGPGTAMIARHLGITLPPRELSAGDAALEPGITSARWFPPQVRFDLPAQAQLMRDGTPVVLPVEHHRWLPHRLDTRYAAAGGTVTRRLAIHDQVVALRLDATGLAGASWMISGGVASAAATALVEGILLIALPQGPVAALWLAGATPTVLTDLPLTYRIQVPAEAPLELLFTIADDRAEALAAVRRWQGRLDAHAAAADAQWAEWFREQVPVLVSEDRALMRAWHTAFALWKLNLLDIPLAPWTGPYTCPSKTGNYWVAWEQDNVPAAALGRWLHDRRAVWAQTTAHLDTGTVLNHNAAPQDAVACEYYLGELMQWAIPWEQLCQMAPPDDELRQRMIDGLLRDERASEALREPDTGLYATWGGLGMDNSPRWDRVSADGGRSDWFLPFHEGLLTPDLNAMIVRRRRLLARLLCEAGRPDAAAEWDQAAARLAVAIHRHLWDGTFGGYVDLTMQGWQPTLARTPAMLMGLSAGGVPAERLPGLLALLDDPAQFGTPVPLPSVAASEPAFEAEGFWRGPVWHRNVWFVDQALTTAGCHAAAGSLTRRYLTGVLRDPVEGREVMDPHSGRKQCAQLFTEGLGMAMDLFVRRVAGLEVEAGELVLRPVALDPAMAPFALGPVQLAGHQITVRWDGRQMVAEVDGRRIMVAPGGMTTAAVSARAFALSH